MKKSIFIIAALLLTFSLYYVACTPPTDQAKETTLPILGNRDISSSGDTIFHQVPDFSFIDQDSNQITNQTFQGKAYITDFFFIHCPSICPKVKAQMIRIYDKFESNDNLVILSHTLDPKRDTIPALKNYAKKLDIKADRWHLVTGEKDLIYSMADDYFIVAKEDPDAPGGFDHSGRIILVDENRHVRAFAEGTDSESVDKFMTEIDLLLKEMN